MPGLVPGIHVFAAKEDVDGRDKPGHDGVLTADTHAISMPPIFRPRATGNKK
jgi:hypothetical protein